MKSLDPDMIPRRHYSLLTRLPGLCLGSLFLALLITAFSPSARAAYEVWTGAGANTSWTTTANWSGNAYPGVTGSTTGNTDIAYFNTPLVGGTVGGSTDPIVFTGNSNFGNVGSLYFIGAAGSYTIGTSSTSTIIGGAVIMSSLTSTSEVTETINANLLVGNSNQINLLDYSGTGYGSGLFIINGNLSCYSTGTTSILLRGGNTNANSVNGLISNGASTSFQVGRTDSGFWQITNNSNTYTGGVNVVAGIFSFPSINSSASTPSAMGEGTQILFGQGSAGNGAELQYTGPTNSNTSTITLTNSTASTGANTNIIQVTTAGQTLTLGGLVSIAVPTSPENLTLDGPGNGALTGGIASSDMTLTVGAQALTPSVPSLTGTWTLSGNNLYTGATSVLGGALVLTSTVSSTVLNVNNGAFSYSNPSTTGTQTFTTTNLGNGGSALSDTVGGDTLALGNLVRSVGGTVDFSSLAGNVTTTSTNTAGTILGGWATVAGGTSWVVSAGTGSVAGAITPLPASGFQNDTWTSGSNTTVTLANNTIGASSTTNSLEFNSSSTATTVTLATTGTETISSGGILVTPNVGNNLSTITSGTLRGSSAGELIINQWNSQNNLTIASVIANYNATATALTISGIGTVNVTSSNNYTGNTYVNGGATLLLGNQYAAQNSNVVVNTGVGTSGANNGVQFQAGLGDAFTIGALSGTNNLALLDTAGNPVALTIGGGNNASTYYGNLSGAGTLTKIGTGNQSLNGVNTYTGNTTISAGTLTISAGSLGSGNYAGNISDAGTFNIGGDGGYNNGGTVSAQVLSGTLSGAGTFTVNSSSGYVILTGPATFTGTTTVTSGLLEFANESSLYGYNTANWTASKIKISAGVLALEVGASPQFTSADIGTLLGMSSSSSGGFENSVFLGLDTTAGNFAYSGVIGNGYSGATLGLDKIGSNTLTLSAANTYSGATYMNGGALLLANEFAAQNTIITIAEGAGLSGLTNGLQFQSGLATGDVFVIGGLANVGLGYANNANNNEDLVDTSGNPVALIIGNNNDTGGTYSGILSGSGSLTKIGTGTQTLSGINTYTGMTTVNGGALSVSGALATGVLTMGGGTFNYTHVNGAGDTQSFTNTNISAGGSEIYTANSGDTLNTGTLARAVGATVDLTATNTGVGAGIITTKSANTAGTILGGWATTNAGSSWAVSAGTGTVVGNITALPASGYQNDLWTSGSNTTVTGNDNYSSSNPSLTTNSLEFNANGAFTVTLGGTNVITSGGILVTSTAGNNVSTIAGGVLEGPAGKELIVNQWDSANSLLISSTVADNTSSTAFTKSGPGLVQLSGANTYSGATYVNVGTLQAGVASVANVSGAFGNNSAVVMANNATATLNLNGFNTQIGSLTGGGFVGGNVVLGSATLTVGGDNTSPAAYAGIISGASGALTKIGTGTLTLSGDSTYTGATNVLAGTLIVSGSLSGSSAVTVGNGSSLTTTAILAGSGTMGNVTLGAVSGNSGAEIEPNAGAAESVGAGVNLTLGNFTVTANSGATVSLLGGRTAAGTSLAGDGSDHISSTGNTGVSLDSAKGNLAFNLQTGYVPQVGDMLYLIISTHAISGTFDTVNGGAFTSIGSGLYEFSLNSGVTTWEISYAATNNSMTGGDDVAVEYLGAIPEPSTWAMMIAGMGMLLCGQRMRRRMTK